MICSGKDGEALPPKYLVLDKYPSLRIKQEKEEVLEEGEVRDVRAEWDTAIFADWQAEEEGLKAPTYLICQTGGLSPTH